jgi:hypothetical protein
MSPEFAKGEWEPSAEILSALFARRICFELFCGRERSREAGGRELFNQKRIAF